MMAISVIIFIGVLFTSVLIYSVYEITHIK